MEHRRLPEGRDRCQEFSLERTLLQMEEKPSLFCLIFDNLDKIAQLLSHS